MREHFCPVEKVGISFENECNWCGEKEMKTIIEMAREAGAVFPADGSYHKFERVCSFDGNVWLFNDAKICFQRSCQLFYGIL